MQGVAVAIVTSAVASVVLAVASCSDASPPSPVPSDAAALVCNGDKPAQIGQCHGIPVGSPIAVTCMDGPPPSMEGGEIKPGIYYLTLQRFHPDPGGATCDSFPATRAFGSFQQCGPHAYFASETHLASAQTTPTVRTIARYADRQTSSQGKANELSLLITCAPDNTGGATLKRLYTFTDGVTPTFAMLSHDDAGKGSVYAEYSYQGAIDPSTVP